MIRTVARIALPALFAASFAVFAPSGLLAHGPRAVLAQFDEPTPDGETTWCPPVNLHVNGHRVRVEFLTDNVRQDMGTLARTREASFSDGVFTVSAGVRFRADIYVDGVLKHQGEFLPAGTHTIHNSTDWWG